MLESGSRIHSIRRTKSYVSVWNITQMHLRNPYVIALWSAIFPGCGHIMLSKYILGFILFIWEIFINYQSQLNLAILYTLLGRFRLAMEVVDTRWLLLYSPTYLYTIWDSYRSCVNINNLYRLASREDAPVESFSINPLGINYLRKKSPWIAFCWSIFSPGAGQLSIRQTIVAFFLIIWWIAIVYLSGVLPAISMSMLGRFDAARSVLNPQWLLNIPSVYFFSMYDAYINTVGNNETLEWELAKYLKNHYQSASFPIPLGKKGGDKVYIVSHLEHTIKTELAINALEEKGILRDHILAVPMDRREQGFCRVNDTDSLSMLDIPMITAAVFALLGLIYGFVLAWGPVLWAIIGTIAGLGVGFLIKFAVNRRRAGVRKNADPGVVLLVDCDAGQTDMVQETLWTYSALGVSKLG